MFKSSARFNPRGPARCRAKAVALAGLVLLALSASAQTPAQPGRVTDRKPAESRPPVAQYDIGLISRRLVALEAQVAELTKRNEAQAAEIAKLKIPHGLTTVKGNTLSAGPSVQDRLNRLEQAMGSHTHYLSGIGVIALNALPGMQDIANKAGVGHVIQQWKDLKVHVTFGTGAGPERTGPPVTQNR